MNLIKKILKFITFFFIIKPFIYFVLGVNVSGAKNLPKINHGPAIFVANHNSHIDTLLLMSLYTCSQILKIHPVAAFDYFCTNRLWRFIIEVLIGAIPIKRKITKSSTEEMYEKINSTLRASESIIIYPEGSRGNNNEIQSFKSGVAHIAQMNPLVPVIPMYINGPDRILPKGELFWIPFIADVYIAEPMYFNNTTTKEFTERIKRSIEKLKEKHKRKEEL